MSKWTKFKNKPILFFRDMINNRMYNSSTKTPNLLLHNINLAVNMSFCSGAAKIILHTGEKHGALGHLNIWIPYFEDSKVPYIIVVRHIEAYESVIEKYPNKKVIFAKRKQDVDYIMSKFKQIKACFYPSNTGNNLHLLFYNNTKHVFIGHGDSDKSASAHKFFRVYDENWVAGNAHIDRFHNAGFDFRGLKQVKVGRPNLYDVIEKSIVSWKDRFNAELRLLYLPTWEGILQEQDYSSLSIIEKNIRKLHTINNLSISLKLHPSSGNREEKFLTLEERFRNEDICSVIEKSRTVNHAIAEANIFICDISAVVSECLAANAPIFIYIPIDKEIKISQSNMPYEKYCYTFSSTDELLEKMQKVLDDDYLSKAREEAMDYILNKDATLDFAFIKQLKKLGEA